jgi:hypothetical protein
LVIGFTEHLQIITTSTIGMSLIHTLYNSLQQALRLLSLLYLHRLSPGNGFQRRSFIGFRVHVLTGRRLSHNSFIAPTNPQAGGYLTPTSYSSRCYPKTLVIAAAPSYIASARTAQKKSPPTVLPLMRARLLRPIPSNGHCLQSHYLA